MPTWLADPETWIAFLTLTALEVVLGVDNVLFIAIVAEGLPPGRRRAARRWGLIAAMGTRLTLLLAISWLFGLTEPLFTIAGRAFSGRDLILLGGGLFLLAKATREIHHEVDEGGGVAARRRSATFGGVLVEIVLLDLVFSLDSVITAVGMADQLAVMAAAIVAAVGVMLVAAEPLAAFVGRHPTVKVLALSFLVLVGTSLVAEGVGFHIPKGYIYFAMAYAVGVEAINLRVRRRHAPRRQASSS